MTDRLLEGRTAIITGAGRGLGKSMAEGLAAYGAKIALVDLEEDILAAAVSDVETAGGQGCALPVTCDVTDRDRAEAAEDRSQQIRVRVRGELADVELTPVLLLHRAHAKTVNQTVMRTLTRGRS